MSAPSTAFVQQYKDTITLLAQQMDARLRPCVMVDTNFKGEKKFYDQYASDSMVEITSRLQDTPVQDADHRRRMVTPRYFVSNTLEDPAEALQMLVDPKSTYMQAKAAAAARKTDKIIIDALEGTAYAGKTGTTSTALPSAQKITAGGTALTKAKVLRAKRIMDAAEIDPEDRFFSYTAVQLEDLLSLTEVTSQDYNTVKALVEGALNGTWVGFKWVHSEQLTLSSTTRYCLAWQKKGLQLAVQKEAEGRLDERKDKNYAWQVYMRIALGAVRLEEERVVQIACVES